VLAHSDDIVTFSSGTIVNHTTFHARAEGANGILLHRYSRSLHNRVTFEEVRDVDGFHVGDEWLRFVLRNHRVNGHSTNSELDRSYSLELL